MAHLVFPRVHQRLLVRVQVQMLQEDRVEELVWIRWLPVLLRLLLCKISYCHPTTLSTAPVGKGGAQDWDLVRGEGCEVGLGRRASWGEVTFTW